MGKSAHPNLCYALNLGMHWSFLKGKVRIDWQPKMKYKYTKRAMARGGGRLKMLISIQKN
jgi:hypothetical protein